MHGKRLCAWFGSSLSATFLFPTPQPTPPVLPGPPVDERAAVLVVVVAGLLLAAGVVILRVLTRSAGASGKQPD